MSDSPPSARTRYTVLILLGGFSLILGAGIIAVAWIVPTKIPYWVSIGIGSLVVLMTAAAVTFLFTKDERTREEREKAGKARKQTYDDAWWIAATILLCLAGAALIASGIIYGVEASARVTTAVVVFQEVANAGTFLAAVAAWVSATASRRKSEKRDSASVRPDSADDQGMSGNDYRFMTEYMSNVMAGRVDAEQSARIERMLKLVKATGKPLRLPVSQNGNGDSSGSRAAAEQPGTGSL
jgi:hypothetical protein